jgi:hypothetical protein
MIAQRRMRWQYEHTSSAKDGAQAARAIRRKIQEPTNGLS